HRAVSRLARHSSDGRHLADVELPELGSLAGLAADHDHDRAFFSFTSFARPPALLRWDADDGVTPWSHLDTAVEPDDYVVEQQRYPSTDGTEVSIFVIRGRDTTPSSDTRTVLTGYGGFAITM